MGTLEIKPEIQDNIGNTRQIIRSEKQDNIADNKSSPELQNNIGNTRNTTEIKDDIGNTRNTIQDTSQHWEE